MVIKFRIKISWIAFTKKMTILELFINAIKKTHDELAKEHLINVDKEQSLQVVQLLNKFKENKTITNLFSTII